MTSQTNEQALEASIEKRLTGTCLEDLKEQGKMNASHERETLYRACNGFYIGLSENYNAKYAIDEQY